MAHSPKNVPPLGHGTVVNDRYEIRQSLGKGGMGEVFLAYDRSTQQPVALKIVREESRMPGDDEALRQELLLARRHPRVPRRGQTLGAMAIAAAVVREGRVCALLTAIAMPAERGGAALSDRPEHAPMLPGHPHRVGVQEAIAMLAHDVGHLNGRPRHRLCFRRVKRAVSGPASVRASSGLATACRCFCERWR